MTKRNTVIGLDIGRHSVKAAWVERHGQSAIVTKTEFLKLPAERSDMAGIAKQWIEKTGIRRHPCVIGIAGQNTVFQPFMAAADDPRTLEQIADMEVVRFNEMASEPMVHGFAPFSMDTPGKRFLLAMSRSSVTEDLLSLAKSIEIQAIDVVPAPVASFNSLQTDEKAATSTNLYINVGHASTEIVVGRRNDLFFARAFGGGGQLFTDAIARATNAGSAHAENAKLSAAGLGQKDQHGDTLQKAADMWFAELQSCLAVFRSLFQHEPAAQPTRVILCGGGGELKGLPEYIAKKLGMPVARADSLPGIPSTDKAMLYTVAAGLGMAGLGIGTTTLSLLPPDVRDEMIFREHKPFWIASAVTAALILVVSVAGGYYDSKRKQAYKQSNLKHIHAQQQLKADIESVKAQSGQIVELAKPLRSLIEGGPLIRDLVTLVADSKSPNDAITVLCDAEAYFNRDLLSVPTPQQIQAAKKDRRRGSKTIDDKIERSRIERVIIEGFTRTYNLSSVKKLITKLNKAPFVESADLLSDDRLAPIDSEITKAIAPGTLRFAIEVKLKRQ